MPYKSSSVIKLQGLSKKIPIRRGVRQGDNLSPKLFTLGLENIFKKLDWMELGINVNGKKLTHLRYADDVVLIASDTTEIKAMLEQQSNE